MDVLKDLHVHTNFCDGTDSPEDIVLSAIAQGITTLGLVAHSHTYFDESYCLPLNKYDAYISEINRLKEKYHDQIEILCGIEQDYYSLAPTRNFDFIIGSVHYIKHEIISRKSVNSVFIPIDETAEILKRAARDYYDNDMMALVEEYYRTLSNVVAKTHANYIGHFDLITKFIETDNLFSPGNRRYTAAWKSCCDTLLEAGVPFEINTGAIARGYRTRPYPSDSIIKYILSHDGKIILNSDSHNRDNLAFQFTQWSSHVTELHSQL